MLDARWILTCGNGISVTDWTPASSLGVKGSRVRIPPSRLGFRWSGSCFESVSWSLRRSGGHGLSHDFSLGKAPSCACT
jgi:hypothetical protein